MPNQRPLVVEDQPSHRRGVRTAPLAEAHLLHSLLAGSEPLPRTAADLQFCELDDLARFEAEGSDTTALGTLK